MKTRFLIFLFLFPASLFAQDNGRQYSEEIKHCIMENDTDYCHQHITPESYSFFDRFVSYKLMPCLPTDFTYQSEEHKAGETIVKASLPAESNKNQTFRLVFIKGKMDIPETFHLGFGENWQNKINMSEQLFLMMRENMQDKLSCDIVRDLARPQR